MTNNKIVIGFIHNGNVASAFFSSMMKVVTWDYEYAETRVWDGFVDAEGPYICDNRNAMITMFLDACEADWLLSIDNDLMVDPDVLIRFMALVNKHNIDSVIGGLTLGPLNFDGDPRYVPLWTHETNGVPYQVMQAVDTDQEIMELTSAGGGFLLISRKVLEKMREVYKDDPWHWFAHDLIEDFYGAPCRMGEDVSFARRVRNCGFKFWGAPQIQALHRQTHFIGVKDIESPFRMQVA